MRPLYRWIAALLLALTVLAVGALSATYTEAFRRWVIAKERALSRRGDPELEALPTLVWAHRGLRGPDAPPNSAKAMRAAAEAGYSGVEMDLRWRASALIVAHDDDEAGEPFARVVAGVRPDQYLWLDFKELSESVARAAAPALRRELPAAMRRRTFIESASLSALARLRAALPGVRSIYTTRSWQRSRFSLGYASLLLEMERRGLCALGFPAAQLSPEIAQALAGCSLFTWTTNDPANLAAQRARAVDVVLTDHLPPGP